MSAPLFERVYRREYGRVVSMLTARVGLQHLESVEDAVQESWASALATWPARGTPDDPAAWLFRAAHNRLLDRLRTQLRRSRILTEAPTAPDATPPEAWLSGDVPDAQLAMLFACCDPVLPVESRRVLALKILFGFTVAELATHLFTSEANVYKRLQRARRSLADAGLDLSQPVTDGRVDMVCSVLHTLFTEGYASARINATVREDLCDEAIRLAIVLAEYPVGDTPQTAALVALMWLHRARLPGRTDGVGGLLLLDEQDRTTWDTACMAEGMRWLAHSAQGEAFTRYHAEAGIAAEHCRASSFESTRWDRVVSNYALLDQAAPSALHRLGHAIALAQWKTPELALGYLRKVAPPSWLAGSFPWFAVLADLHQRCGHVREAERHRALALELAPTPAIAALLERRLNRSRPG